MASIYIEFRRNFRSRKLSVISGVPDPFRQYRKFGSSLI